jgi:DNA-directed RNA polymerase specialized sigma24 family protein
MIESPDTDRSDDGGQLKLLRAATEHARVWFLPLESVLMQYLHRNWRRKDDIPDLQNDIYVLVYQAAFQKIPNKPQQFVVTTAHNLLINRLGNQTYGYPRTIS